MIVDPERVTAAIAEAAAIEVMPRFKKLLPSEIHAKAPNDMVTVADQAMEQRLGPLLVAMIPGATVIGEEAAAADATLLDRLKGEGDFWIIDPIDGTANFIEGRPHFATMVALLRGGRLMQGWIHDPVAGETAFAIRGGGAWAGKRRLTVAKSPTNPAELVGTLHGGSLGDKSFGQRIQKRRNRVRAIKSLRAGSHEYLRLARGETHFSLFTQLMPWDHAPGALLHSEAGGHGGYVDSGDSYEAARVGERGWLLAPDRASWQALHRLLIAEEA